MINESNSKIKRCNLFPAILDYQMAAMKTNCISIEPLMCKLDWHLDDAITMLSEVKTACLCG